MCVCDVCVNVYVSVVYVHEIVCMCVYVCLYASMCMGMSVCVIVCARAHACIWVAVCASVWMDARVRTRVLRCGLHPAGTS